MAKSSSERVNDAQVVVSDADLREVAKRVKRLLGGDAFRSIQRRDLTDLVREVSGLATTRLKAEMAARLTDQLQRQGVRVFPPLTETATSDAVRIFHCGTVVADLVDMLETPGAATDAELAIVTSKVKWPRELRELGWSKSSNHDGVDRQPEGGAK